MSLVLHQQRSDSLSLRVSSPYMLFPRKKISFPEEQKQVQTGKRNVA
jgi:hypothetical protein